MQGNIMDSMLHPKGVLGAGGIQPDKKPPRSQAFSTGSAFSQMKTGAFFKMVDSPFKASIMNAYDKMQAKQISGTVYGGGAVNNGHSFNRLGSGGPGMLNPNYY